MAGLRERKKQQTRQRISDLATGLFLERGFDAVTVAEIAEAAEVSVNTVYNYFPSKEDLFFDREEEVVERWSAIVRERGPGESAARVVLRRMRRDLEERSSDAGLTDGYARFLRCARESPSLIARLFLMQARAVSRLTGTLREEAAAEPGDATPEAVAVQITGIGNAVLRTVMEGVVRGDDRDELAEAALVKLAAFEALLSDDVLNYATRPPG